MNEEQIRKEFEEWCRQQWFINIEKLQDGKYLSQQTEIKWTVWKESREAMKPIKLPVKMKNTEAAECYYYNDAIDECKEAIQQAGYKVAP